MAYNQAKNNSVNSAAGGTLKRQGMVKMFGDEQRALKANMSVARVRWRLLLDGVGSVWPWLILCS